MIGEVERLLDNGIDVDAFTGPLARVQQHIFDDQISAAAVLCDLVEVGRDRCDEFVDFRACMRIEPALREQLAQLVQELARQVGKIVHEIERVLHLVSNPRGELAERG